VIQVHGRVSWSDYLRAQYLHLRPRPAWVCAGIGIVALGLAILAAALARTLAGDPPPRFPYLLLVSLGYLGLYFCVFVPWRAHALYRRQTGAESSFRILADSDGLVVSSELGELRLPWTVLRKWKESASLFLIYRSDSLFHLVPKRLFSSSDQVEAFRSLLRRNLARAA